MKLSVVAAICVIFSAPLPAQQNNLNEIVEHLAEKIHDAKLKSVAVFDFLTPDGKPCGAGWYLAERVSDNLSNEHRGFAVLERSRLKKAKLAPEDMHSPKAIEELGHSLAADTILTGIVDAQPAGYELLIVATSVRDQSVVARISFGVAHSRILDLLGPNGLLAENVAPVASGTGGTSVPECTYCPAPNYSATARGAHVEGVVILSVVISTEGRAEKIVLVNDAGYGLAVKAIDAVSEWKFKPAMNKDGKPVATIVPIEVTFRPFP